MSRLAFLHSLTAMNALAPSALNDNPVGRAEFDPYGEAGWVTLRHDPTTTGLHVQGRWQAELEIATNATMVLLAQILPTRINITDSDSVSAVRMEECWIDVRLRQFAPTHASLSGLSMLELSAHKMLANEVKLIKCVKASPMPMEMMSAFTLGYRLKHGKIVVEISSDLDKQSVTRMDVAPFGETLPWVKLRSGRQPLNTGIFRAKFQQKVSWSA